MRIVMALALLWGGAILSSGATAQTVYEFPSDEAESAFIANEVAATFYHELGHALIDVLHLPVLGKEEDAADHLSVILMDDIWEEESAANILASDATAYALQAEQTAAGGAEPLYSDEHSLDMQRYYSVVCLFYGANPEKRQKLADDLGLPVERAERCASEWDEAKGSWDAVLADATPGGDNKGFVMAEGQEGQPLADLLAEEVKSINERFGLPEEVTVVVADCGVANAFYNSDDKTITMCTEYAQNLQDMWEAQ
jgi:Putative metallopeptidase